MRHHGNWWYNSHVVTKTTNNIESEKDMEDHKLVNDYVREKKKLAIIELKLKSENKTLYLELETQKKLIKGLQASAKKMLQKSNSKRIESKTHWLTLETVPISAHDRNTIYIDKA